MFFEEGATKLVLTDSLYQELCKNLKPDIKDVGPLVLIFCSLLILSQYIPPTNPKGDQWELKSMLFQYAKQEFRSKFGFEWAGKNTKPIEPVLKFRLPFSTLFDLEVDDDSPTKEAIERRVSLAAFRYGCNRQFFLIMALKNLPERMDTSSPGAPDRSYRVCTFAFLHKSDTDVPCIIAWLFNDLVERIQSWDKEVKMVSNVIGGDGANFWHSQSIQQQRPIDGTGDTWVKQYSTFVFTVAKKAAGTERINRFFVYYLSVGFPISHEGGILKVF